MDIYSKYYGMYKRQLKNKMDESLLGFCHWLVDRLEQYEATKAAQVPHGK